MSYLAPRRRRFDGRDFMWLCAGIWIGAMGTVGIAYFWERVL